MDVSAIYGGAHNTSDPLIFSHLWGGAHLVTIVFLWWSLTSNPSFIHEQREWPTKPVNDMNHWNPDSLMTGSLLMAYVGCLAYYNPYITAWVEFHPPYIQRISNLRDPWRWNFGSIPRVREVNLVIFIIMIGYDFCIFFGLYLWNMLPKSKQ